MELLAELAARRDIADCVHRYMRGLDRLDRACVLSAFHPDARVDCGLMAGNPAAFADFALDLLAGMEATHHMLGQVRIVMESDGTATGESYFQAWHDVRGEDGSVRDLFIAGRYLDRYTVADGAWRIAARTLVTDWSIEAAGDRSFFTANPDAPRGGRRGEDPSELRG